MVQGQNIRLSKETIESLEQHMQSGAYKDANEVISTSLELLDRRKEKIEILQKEILKGRESGVAEEFNFSDFRKQTYPS